MPTTGYIQLQFNATYLGDYRVCWREGNIGPRTCFTVNCGSLGLCTVYITPVTFVTNACDGTINYNGYVQSACEDPNSTEGAVFWNVDYDIVTDCTPREITCLGVTTAPAYSLTVTGSGISAFNPTVNNETALACLCNLGPHWNATQVYNTDLLLSPWGPNNLSISTSTGVVNWAPGTLFCGRFEGAANLATITGNILPNPCNPNQSAQTGNQFGNQCILKPIIVISPPPPGGTQATAEAVMGLGGITPGTPISIVLNATGGIDGTYNVWNTYNGNSRGKNFFQVKVAGGSVVSITPLATPRGYYFGTGIEFFSFNPAQIGWPSGYPAGQQVIGQKPSGLNTTDYGKVIGIIVTNPGSGYLTTPTVTSIVTNCYQPAAQLQLQIQSNFSPGGTGPCPSFVPGTGCGTYPGNISPTIPPLPAGTTLTLCYPSNVTNPPWTINDSWEINNDAEGCCYDCVDIAVQATPANPNPQLVYTDCNTQRVVVTTMTNSSVAIACVVNGSWASTASDTVFTITGTCIL